MPDPRQTRHGLRQRRHGRGKVSPTKSKTSLHSLTRQLLPIIPKIHQSRRSTQCGVRNTSFNKNSTSTSKRVLVKAKQILVIAKRLLIA